MAFLRTTSARGTPSSGRGERLLERAGSGLQEQRTRGSARVEDASRSFAKTARAAHPRDEVAGRFPPLLSGSRHTAEAPGEGPAGGERRVESGAGGRQRVVERLVAHSGLADLLDRVQARFQHGREDRRVEI